jgi:hypothetical protein
MLAQTRLHHRKFRFPAKRLTGILVMVLGSVLFVGCSPAAGPASTVTAAPALTDSAPATSTPIPSNTPLPTATLTPSPTLVPTSTATASATTVGLYYANSFEENEAGFSDWIIHEIVDTRHFEHVGPYLFELSEGKKQIVDATDQPMVYAIYERRLPLSGWVISEEMEFVGTGAVSHGLICRYSTQGWYEMSFSSDGGWKIELVEGEAEDLDRTTLAEGNSEAIKPAFNRLGISCVGDTLSLSANGQVLGSVQDGTLTEGNMVGFSYRDDLAADVHLEISKFYLTDAGGKPVIEFSVEANSFYFADQSWAVSAGFPADVRSTVPSFTETNLFSGQAVVSINQPGRWIAIYPGELPYNIEMSVDTEILNGSRVGVGVMCRWSEEKGGYALWYTDRWDIITPYNIDPYGVPVSVGTAEFNSTNWASLLAGPEHRITARCWNDLVDLIIDGQLVSSHKTSTFPYEGNANKAGKMVGLMVWTLDPAGATVTFDNLTISWNANLPTPPPKATP